MGGVDCTGFYVVIRYLGISKEFWMLTLVKLKRLGHWLTAGCLFLLIGLLAGCASRRMAVPGKRESPKPLYQSIRVALGTHSGKYTLKFLSPYKVRIEEATYILDATNGVFTVTLTSEAVELRSKNRYLRLPVPVAIAFIPLESPGEFQWGEKTLVGQIFLHANQQEKAISVSMPLEPYVLGVLSAEMPTHEAAYLEALKAQAVAARTYAVWRMRHPRHPWYDIFSDVQDQVLGSVAPATAIARQAVDATRGVVLISEASGTPQVAAIHYHSTCGGVFEIQRNDSLDQKESRADGVEENNCELSPLFRWARIVTADQILQNLATWQFIPEQKVASLKQTGYSLQLSILKRSVSGRVKQMQVILNGQSFVLSGYTIRRILGEGGGRNLPSNYFFLLPQPHSQTQFYIFGAGFGHGQGMCQWGAIGQALSGKDWQKILKFYYPYLSLTNTLP